MLDVERLRQLVQAGARLGVLAQERLHGVGDLAATAVPDRDVDVQADDAGGGVLRRDQRLDRVVGEQVERADGLEPPAAGGGERADGVLDDREQLLELVGAAGEVVRGEHPERDHLDADVLAPLEQVGDLVGARLVPCRVDSPMLRAQRRLPSRMTPTWRGSPSFGSDAASWRSYSP